MKNCDTSIKLSKDKNTNKSKLKAEKKTGKSPRHRNVLRRRLGKWVNESDRGNIVIESMINYLKNNKALISLRQFRMSDGKKKNSSKAVFGDVMVIHSDNLNSFIKRLQEIRDNLIDNTLNETDESEQSELRKQLSEFAAEEIAAEEIRNLCGPAAEKTCYMCEIDEPSQEEPQVTLSSLFKQLISV